MEDLIKQLRSNLRTLKALEASNVNGGLDPYFKELIKIEITHTQELLAGLEVANV